MARKSGHKIRYAVVGLGHIGQAAVLPAFAHASQNSSLTALVSDTPTKLRQLGRRYKVEHTYSYKEYDDCLLRFHSKIFNPAKYSQSWCHPEPTVFDPQLGIGF